MKKTVYFLFALVVMVFFGFQNQEDQKFYYAFNEKILLTEVENKFVIRYSESMGRATASSILTKLDVKCYCPSHSSNMRFAAFTMAL